MTRLSNEFAMAPEDAAAEQDAAERERGRRRAEVDTGRLGRLVGSLEVGDAPNVARGAATEAELLVRAGADPEVVRRLLEFGASSGATEREAVLARAREQATTPRAKPTTRRGIPDLDADDLLRECPTARGQVREVARRALACEDLTALAWLPAVSAALAAKVRGVTHNNDGSVWRIPPRIFVGAEAPSGANKSLIANAMLRDHLCHSGGIWGKVRAEFADDATADRLDREDFEDERRRLSRDRSMHRERLTQIDDRLRRPKVVQPLVEELFSPSPEKFTKLCHQAGFRCVVPDEAADFLHRFFGDKNTNEKIGVLIAGFDGSEFAYSSLAGEERGDDAIRFARIHLTILLLLQEGVLSPRVRDEASRLAAVTDRGFFPRCIIARPRALTVAERREREIAAQLDAEQGRWPQYGKPYERILRSIADYRVGDHALAPSEPLLIPFTPEATRVRRAYQVQCGDAVAADGPDVGRPGARSIARMHDHAARIAICLAVWRCAEEADAEGQALDLRRATVEVADVERAVRACESYFRPHALAVAGRAILDPAGDDAEHVLTVVRNASPTRQRDLQRAMGRGWDVKRLRRALDELEARGDVQVETSARNTVTIRLAPGA